MSEFVEIKTEITVPTEGKLEDRLALVKASLEELGYKVSIGDLKHKAYDKSLQPCCLQAKKNVGYCYGDLSGRIEGTKFIWMADELDMNRRYADIKDKLPGIYASKKVEKLLPLLKMKGYNFTKTTTATGYQYIGSKF